MRKWIPVVALAALLMTAAPVAAGRPDGKGPPSGGHPPGETCAEAGLSGDVAWSASGFTLTLGDREWGCVDVPVVAGAGDVWDITVTVGSAREVSFMIKDAQPGDFCFPTVFTSSATTYEALLRLGEDDGGCFGDEYSDSDPSQLVFAAQASYKGKKVSEAATIVVTLP